MFPLHSGLTKLGLTRLLRPHRPGGLGRSRICRIRCASASGVESVRGLRRHRRPNGCRWCSDRVARVAGREQHPGDLGWSWRASASCRSSSMFGKPISVNSRSIPLLAAHRRRLRWPRLACRHVEPSQHSACTYRCVPPRSSSTTQNSSPEPWSRAVALMPVDRRLSSSPRPAGRCLTAVPWPSSLHPHGSPDRRLNR